MVLGWEGGGYHISVNKAQLSISIRYVFLAKAKFPFPASQSREHEVGIIRKKRKDISSGRSHFSISRIAV